MEESSDLLTENSDQFEKERESLGIEDIANDLIDIVQTENDASRKTATETLSKPARHLKLPFSRIKQIMKLDPDVIMVQQDAVFLVTKATELFIEFLAKETNKQLAGNKRKTVMKRDVDVAIETIPQLCFLDGALE